MRSFLAIMLLVLSSSWSYAFENCCFCVADDMDSEVTAKECQKWLKRQNRKSRCDYKEVIPSATDLAVKGATCERAQIYGAYHGLSILEEYPFLISLEVSQKTGAREINYDGSTCLVFNNTENIIENAHLLAKIDPQTKYTISGNQNIGIIGTFFLFSPYKEIKRTSSKMTVTIDRGVTTHQYAECTKAKKLCGHAFSGDDIGATNDSNTKYCMHQGKVVTQTCCVKSAFDDYGKWGRPGESCK